MVSADVDLTVELAGLALRSPLTTASGTFGSGQHFAELWLEQQLVSKESPFLSLGALTTKGVSFEPWTGNSGLRIDETASGLLNSIGLENLGVEAFCADDLAWLAKQDVPVIVNVCGHSVADYQAVIERLESESVVSAYELNISCPNVDNSGMAFGVNPQAAAQVTAACRQLSKRPLIAKLTPNVTEISEVAKAVADAGADAISLINTVAGMSIDLSKRQPVFDRVLAGLSGPAIKPIALWAVYRVYQAVSLPIIGMGGVCSAADVIEFILAGATAVAVGSHSFSDPLAIPRIHADLYDWCRDNSVSAICDLRGAVHAARPARPT